MNRKVLITDSVHPVLIEGLKEMGFTIDYNPSIPLKEVRTIASEYEGMIINSKILVDKQMLDAAVQLKFVGRLGSGMEIIDQEYAHTKKVAILNAPRGNCNAVAEHALGMLLALANKLIQGDTQVRQQIWDREANRGYEIMGKTVGIIGFGHTGSAFASKLNGLGLRILAYDKYKHDYAIPFPYVEETNMQEIFEEADIISFHLPLTEEVIHLANGDYFHQFRKPILVINTSRGKVIPTEDLIFALKSGKIVGACLDVFENEKPKTFTSQEEKIYQELYQLPNTILSPHVAGWTVESKKRLASILLHKIRGVY